MNSSRICHAIAQSTRFNRADADSETYLTKKSKRVDAFQGNRQSSHKPGSHERQSKDLA